jgi:hypothetical protein
VTRRQPTAAGESGSGSGTATAVTGLASTQHGSRADSAALQSGSLIQGMPDDPGGVRLMARVNARREAQRVRIEAMAQAMLAQDEMDNGSAAAAPLANVAAATVTAMLPDAALRVDRGAATQWTADSTSAMLDLMTALRSGADPTLVAQAREVCVPLPCTFRHFRTHQPLQPSADVQRERTVRTYSAEVYVPACGDWDRDIIAACGALFSHIRGQSTLSWSWEIYFDLPLRGQLLCHALSQLWLVCSSSSYCCSCSCSCRYRCSCLL